MWTGRSKKTCINVASPSSNPGPYPKKNKDQYRIPGVAIIYWYLGNGKGWLIDWQKKILLDGLMDR